MKFKSWRGKLVVLGIFVLSCYICCSRGYLYISYEGDGEFIDNGFLSHSPRYVLYLDDIDLTGDFKKTYTMKKLPLPGMIFGLSLEVNRKEISLEKAAPDVIAAMVGENSRYDIDIVLSITITDSAGKVVLDLSDPLGKWTWTYAQPHPDIRPYPNDVMIYHIQPGDYHADSFLETKSNEEYKIMVKIDKGKEGFRGLKSARIVGEGGGWSE